jgi:hypothetical protein
MCFLGSRREELINWRQPCSASFLGLPIFSRVVVAGNMGVEQVTVTVLATIAAAM